MYLQKQIGRVVYILTEPGNFLRLVRAWFSNLWIMVAGCFFKPRVKCNLCGWEGVRFHYFLERSFIKKDAVCPACGSMSRNRLLMEFLLNRQEVADKLVLDVSPVPSYKRVLEEAGARYVSIDYGGRRVSARMDLAKLGFKPGIFDIVICSHVLEHIKDYSRALAEIKRVLAKEGIAIIDVPYRRKGKSVRLEVPDHQGHWHSFAPDVTEQIKAAGFKVHLENYDADADPQEPSNTFFLCKPV